MVGRTTETQTITAAVSAPDLCGIVVSGSPGVGKSRLVREALRAFDARWVVGTTSARELPLGAFASWAGEAAGDRLQLVRGVIDAVTASLDGTPAVIAVDDAHLLDDLSVFVLHQIVYRRAARVVLTVRAGDAIPDSVRELWKDHPFGRLDLQPLAEQDSAELLTAALGAPVDTDAARRLWQLTRGNALYLRNIVEQELADGRLQRQHGCWHWVGQPVLPATLVDLVEARLGELHPALGDVLDALAVGEPIKLSTLHRIASPEAVEEANVRGLIALENTDECVEVRVAHPLYGEVRRMRSPAATLRRLRGLVAEELAAGGNRDDLQVAVRRATLSMGSDLAPDPDLLLTAARGAICLADLPLAERLAAGAMQADAGPHASFLRAHALSWMFRGDAAEEVLAAVPTDTLPDPDRARFAYLRASNLLWAMFQPDRAKDHVDEVARTLGPAVRPWLDAFLVVYWFAMDRPAEAEAAADNLALPDLPGAIGAETAWALTTVAADAGRTDEAVATAAIGYRVSADSFDTPHIRFNLADSELTALALAGRLTEAGQVAERIRGESADLPGAAHSLGAAIAGRAALAGGRLDTAHALFEQVALEMADHALGWGFRYSVARATVLAMRGSPAEAASILDRLDGLPRPFRALDYERRLARAWVSANQGTLREAISIALAAAESASAKGQFAAEVLCLQTAAQFGDHTRTDRLTQLAVLVEGPRAAVAARFAAALRDGDADELYAVANDFEKIGDPLGAVDAASHAATAFRRRDRRGSALGCSTRAEALARQCGVVTPALRQAGERIPLTTREREVVALIATGLPTRAIADRLCLSSRTVEGHIYRAMAKTGTTSREELAALLNQHRP
jgi:DNA-binding CsgD family transcriptional regulator/tetratricopeptide (TPR) repeat protein